MKNLIIIIVLWFLLPLTALSQLRSEASIKIKGQITDSTDYRSIPFATITIMKMPEKMVERRIAANADGLFETSLKSAGNYMLVANSLGYSAKSQLFSIKSEQQLIDIGKLILRQSNLELKEVQVTAEKPLVKIESDKLSYNAESDPESKSSNALDLLRKVPFITVDGDDNVQVKGSSNYKVFMNGKPSTMASNNPRDFFKNFPASSIKNIEVITSPGAKYDAEGVGGIINIVTQKKSLTNGYTCTVNGATNTLGAVSGGVNFSASIGKFGISTDLANYYQDFPYFKSITYRESFEDTPQKYSYWNGKSRNKGMSPWGTGELSYEIDTLNLINASFSLWLSQYQNTSKVLVSIQDANYIENQSYYMSTMNESNFGAPEGNIDYQRTSKRNKDQVFTLSYKVNYNPTGREGESSIDNYLNYFNSKQLSDNNAYTLEHTFQSDFVQPLKNNNKLELGLKYILRKNLSLTDVRVYDYDLLQFVVDSNQINDFDYTQNIIATYLTYNKKIKKFDLKSGLRVEDVFTDGTFTSKNFTDFENKNLEFVPSANISYQINEKNNLRLSYNKRIQRPSIWYLNPFVNNFDPKNISYGNPNLDPERFHNIELNYSNFSKIGNINLTLYNSFSNNGIDRVVSLEDGVSTATFANVNRIRTWGLSSFISVRLGKKFNGSVNGSINYNFLEGNNFEGLKNEGWGFNINSNLQYTIVKGLKISGYGMMFNPPVRLQMKASPFYNMGFALGKDFLDSKMTLTLTARNIFWKEMKFSFVTNDPSFYQESEMYRAGRYVSISLRYRFGEMNSQIKKAKRGIRNDDLKAGEGSGNGNGGN